MKKTNIISFIIDGCGNDHFIRSSNECSGGNDCS